jgi:flagella basal body P-ring formation protein FlgA
MRTFLGLVFSVTAAWGEPGVAERAQNWLAPGPSVRLEVRGSVAATSTPAGKLQWKCTTLAGLESPNPRVRVEVAGQDGKRSWVVAFDKQVLVTQKLALRPLSAGTPLREEDFHAIQVWVTAQQVSSGAYTGPYDGRFRLRRTLPAQTPLTASCVEAIPYCEAGCQVDIHVRQPGLALTLSGKALERGYADRPLRVRLENGGTMQAWYDKDGQLTDRRNP